MIDRQYPIGRVLLQADYTTDEMNEMIEKIVATSVKYRGCVENLSEEALAKTYREGSWDIRQIVHHVADIALLHFFRMKKEITEPGSEMAVIHMDEWAKTVDAQQYPVDDSLLMLASISNRYASLIRSLTEDQLQQSYFHPVRQIRITQKQAVAMSAWHLEHHLAHIKLALQ